MKAALTSALQALIPGAAMSTLPHGWRNWAGNQRTNPSRILMPSTEEGVVAAIGQARSEGTVLKAVGGSHSFSDIAAPEGILLSLDSYVGLLRVNRETGEATFRAGTRLYDVAGLLKPYGLALANMGDIDRQSIAGALSTSTHGTGLGFTGYGGMVTGLRIALGTGEVVSCSAEENPEIFEAARVGLGAIGIILEATLRCVPAFALEAVEKAEPLGAVVDGFVERCQSSDHFEFYWFPGTDVALTKTNTRLPADTPAHRQNPVKRFIDDELVSNGLYSLICRVGSRASGIVPTANSLATKLVSERTFRAPSHEVFVAPRRVHFREMEYALPLQNAPEIIREVMDTINAFGEPISFPLEIRSAAADEVWMSTAHGRQSVYIAVHRYFREEHTEYFAAVEQVFLKHGGRPHWGKMHTLTAAELEGRYPKFQDFKRVRAAADPDGVFANDYVKRVLGL